MTFKKRCIEKGCDGRRNCGHQYHVQGWVKGVRIKGPVGNWAFLLPPLAKLPTTAEGFRDFESLLRVWVAQGQPKPTTMTISDDDDDAAAGATIRDLCDKYQKKHLPTMTCKATPGHIARIKEQFGHEPLAWLCNQVALSDFLDELVEEAQARSSCNPFSTHDAYIRRLSHLLTFARLHFRLKGDSPFRHKQLNPNGIAKRSDAAARNRTLEPWEEQGLVDYFTTLDDDGMMLGRFYCALDCGPRRGEMMEVTKRDLKWNYQGEGLYIVLRAETTKSGKERALPVTSKRLTEFLEKRKFKDFTFGTADGQHRESLYRFRGHWENALLHAKIDKGEWDGHTWKRTADGDLHWHDLRHEYATRLHNRGMSTRKLQELLGHHSIEVTERYLNIANKDIRSEQAAIQASMGL
jgi:integrase